MTPLEVVPDDEIYRFDSVYLGAKGMSIPWRARYSAYVVGILLFLAIITVEAILPGVSVNLPPVWEITLTILGTSLVMLAVDHDRSPMAVIGGVVTGYRVRLTTPPPARATRPRATTVKIDRTPR